MEHMTQEGIRTRNIAEHIAVHHEEVEILLIDTLCKGLEVSIFSMYIAKHEETALVRISIKSPDDTVACDLHSTLRTVVHSISTFVILDNLCIDAVAIRLSRLKTCHRNTVKLACDSSSCHHIIKSLTVTHLERSAVIRSYLDISEILLS